jgi:Ca2+-transporting ATPase
MSTIVKFEQQHHYRVFTKGASEIVLGLCNQYMDVDGNVLEIDQERRQSISDDIERMASKGLRTICIAFNDFVQDNEQNITPELVEKDLICVAIVGIKDPLREEVTDSIIRCKGAGILVRMVTGDNISTAKHIARECGIYDPDIGGIAMEGPEFRSLMRPAKNSDDPMSGPEFRARITPRMLEILPNLQVLARSSPTDKHLLVSCLKELGDVVSVTGDGTNDAPALKAANVGLSMGVSGTEVAKEASDIVIMDDNFASIVKSVLWGRSVYENVRKFLQFQITINVAAVLVTFIGSVSGQGFPLTAVQLLWINLIMDTFAALALATEPPTDDLLLQKP